MKQLIWESDMAYFDKTADFAGEYKIGEGDLLLTNEWIYKPFFEPLGIQCNVIFQEKYGSGEPTDVMVEAIMAEAAKSGYKRVIAVGGGTIIDIAKVLAVAGNETLDELYADVSKIEKRHKLLIIPTTCGTGSEVTNIAVINRTKMGVKMGLVSPNMFADEAVLIPELLTTLPFGVFATSSIDALVHAVESSLSPLATPYTKLFGYKAIEMIIKGYREIAKNGKEALNSSLLKKFLIASNFAGLAFGTAGCGAVHAMAYPLGGTYHVAHGESNAVLFTGVMKNYLKYKTDGEIDTMLSYLAGLLDCEKKDAFDKLDELLSVILPKKKLREYGMKPEECQSFAENCFNTQQRLLGKAFIPMDVEKMAAIYGELY